jgi:SulP family sulfate permease
MSTAVEVAAAPDGVRLPYDTAEATDPAVLLYRIRGAVVFGAVSAVGAAHERIGDGHRVLVIDFTAVTLVDSSAARMIEGLAHKARRRGVAIYLTGTTPGLRRELLAHGARPPLVRYAKDIETAVQVARRRGA